MLEGKISQVIGPVVDVRFDNNHIPAIYNAIEVKMNDNSTLVLEVAQHIGDDVVRCIAMASTDGLVRQMTAVDTGHPIRVPVGKAVLGRMFNVLGLPIDEMPMPSDVEAYLPIHRQPPEFKYQQPIDDIQETGIKVIDLL